MVQKTTNGLYQSSALLQDGGITHGFTSKMHGSMINELQRNAFLDRVGLQSHALVWAEQNHGTTIHIVTPEDMGKTIADVDGFVYKKRSGIEEQPILAVHVGDCVPLLFIDQTKDIIGVAHAGWKGTKDHIARSMVRSFLRLGSDPKHIMVVIGPYIHACCYAVTEERAMTFEREFPGSRGIVNRFGTFWYIDIGNAVIADLRSAGVLSTHIDKNDQLCTKCHDLEFYSFRRKTEGFGEIMGYIGYTKQI